jgi:hypothetical protein
LLVSLSTMVSDIVLDEALAEQLAAVGKLWPRASAQ